MARAYNGGSYTDWYLPSKDELNKLYLNKAAIGGFAVAGGYWSSSENDAYTVWVQNSRDGTGNYFYGDMGFWVRAVRSFWRLIHSLGEGRGRKPPAGGVCGAPCPG